MKTKLRRISFIMIMVLLFATIPMYNGERNAIYFASENQDDNVPEGMKSDAEMIALALEYFPEYSEKINNPIPMNFLQARILGDDDVLVINETKNISNLERIVYQEYASGRANVLFIVTEDVVLTQNGSGRQMYEKLNIQVHSAFLLGQMYIMGFAYTIYYDGYDLINDFGDITVSNLPITTASWKANEDVNGPASAGYSAVFEFPDGHWFAGQTVTCALEILVGDNECSIEVY